MNQIASYSRVQLDPQFRKEKIGEARYQTKIAAGLAVVGVASWLSYVTYAEIAEKRWPGDVGVILLLVLCASFYSQARSRLKALQAMESTEPNQARAVLKR